MSAVAEQVVSNEFALKLDQQFPGASLFVQQTVDEIATIWVERSRLREIIRFVKDSGFEMLFDLCGVDERLREHRDGLPAADLAGDDRSLLLKASVTLRAVAGNDQTRPTAWTLSTPSTGLSLLAS